MEFSVGHGILEFRGVSLLPTSRRQGFCDLGVAWGAGCRCEVVFSSTRFSHFWSTSRFYTLQKRFSRSFFWFNYSALQKQFLSIFLWNHFFTSLQTQIGPFFVGPLLSSLSKLSPRIVSVFYIWTFVTSCSRMRLYGILFAAQGNLKQMQKSWSAVFLSTGIRRACRGS